MAERFATVLLVHPRQSIHTQTGAVVRRRQTYGSFLNRDERTFVFDQAGETLTLWVDGEFKVKIEYNGQGTEMKWIFPDDLPLLSSIQNGQSVALPGNAGTKRFELLPAGSPIVPDLPIHPMDPTLTDPGNDGDIDPNFGVVTPALPDDFTGIPAPILPQEGAGAITAVLPIDTLESHILSKVDPASPLLRDDSIEGMEDSTDLR